MTSIVPLSSSVSLRVQSIGWNLALIPSSLVTSLARSISKPTILSFSSLKPIGTNVSSIPITNSFFSLISSHLLAFVFSSAFPQPAKISERPRTVPPIFNNRFIIFPPLYFILN